MPPEVNRHIGQDTDMAKDVMVGTQYGEGGVSRDAIMGMCQLMTTLPRSQKQNM